MFTPVKSLEVTYKAPNRTNTFTNGDCISGQVTLEVDKEYEIDSLSIKLEAKADVKWSEQLGYDISNYHSMAKYFSISHYFIQDKHCKDNRVVGLGRHVYPFTFQFPLQEMPSSFRGHDGKIVYLLEAILGRSMWLDKTDSTQINFVSKVDVTKDPGLMIPQHESKLDKRILFASGTIIMDVKTEKTGYFQGEGLVVVARIMNNSSREIKPKYCVYRKHSFFADGKRRLHTKYLLKEVGEPIPPSANKRVARVITIPHHVEPSILNCSTIKVEYRLRAPAVGPPPVSPSKAAFKASPHASASKASSNPNPPVQDVLPPQQPSEPEPSDPPPSYDECALCPFMMDYGNK
ncbi:arrestin domain-containing protein 3-like [Scomber scombrus]|uniref:Arrestin domain-containing protein 3-like n=1 Tax=Scomber scombrus TaxID=13677 RepID=A0AAV1PGG9_SCOSC